MAQLPPSDTLKEGFLTKQGGVTYHNWKERWFVLKEESLSYYIKEGDAKAKKMINLKHGRGVRTKDQCSVKTWPGDATFCFGLATSKRTWYFYGSEDKDVREWSELIQQCIEKVGKPTSDWKSDVDGKPEGMASKVIRGTVKQTAKFAKEFIPSTGNEYVDAALKTGLDVVESQAGADAKTTMKDRLKMAGGDVISGVADTVDNPAMSVVGNVAKDQLKAPLKQGLALPGGGAVKGVGGVTGIGAVNIAAHLAPAGGYPKQQPTANQFYPQQQPAMQYPTNTSLPAAYLTMSQNAYPPIQGGMYPLTQGTYPQTPPPGYTQVPPPQVPPAAPQPYQGTQPAGVTVGGQFDPGARFDPNRPVNIPPLPSGVAPTAAQTAAAQGQPIVMAQGKSDVLIGFDGVD